MNAIRLIMILCILACAESARAEEDEAPGIFGVTGRITQSTSVFYQPFTDVPNVLARVDAEASRDLGFGPFSMRLRPWAWAWIPDAVGGLSREARGFVELKEGWIEFRREAWNLRVGNQIIEWGTADGFNPTSFWNARDFTDPFQSKALPATTARLQIASPSLENWEFELLFSPFFREPRLPVVFPSVGTTALQTSTTRWLGPLPRAALLGQLGVPLQYQLGAGSYPQTWQLGARIKALSLGGWDLSISGFTGVDRVPRVWVLAEGASPTTLTLRPTYHRELAFGLDGERALESIPVSFRFELAYHVRDNARVYDAPASVQSQLLRDNDLIGVAGLDYRPESSFLTFRYWNLAFLLRQKFGNQEQPGFYSGFAGLPQLVPIDRNLSLYWENALWKDWLVMKSTILWSLANADLLLSLGSYSERGGNWRAGLVTDFFMGSRSGFLGQFADNSRVRFELGFEF